MNMKENEIINNISGIMGDEFVSKEEVVSASSEAFGYKRVTTNFILRKLINTGVVEEINEDGVKMIRKITEPTVETVVEPKKAPTPEARERRTLEITEEEAEGLSLLTLRTPPVKKDLVYPDGVTKEMFDEFKTRIIEHGELLKDLITNFNGAKNTAITMWDPENKKANENGKVFYRWDEPVESWDLMTQLNKVINLYEEAQEANKVEVEVVE